MNAELGICCSSYSPAPTYDSLHRQVWLEVVLEVTRCAKHLSLHLRPTAHMCLPPATVDLASNRLVGRQLNDRT